MSSSINPASSGNTPAPPPTSEQIQTATQTATITDELGAPQLDADPDVEMVGTNAHMSSSTLDAEMGDAFGEGVGSAGGEGNGQQQGTTQAEDTTAMDINLEEGRMPIRKDVSLKELISKIDDYPPV
ncbi:MAG: hypothetical protein LQ340_001660, partial [Diploschistes diacapsis]